MVFVHMWHFDTDFQFLIFYDLIFGNGFPNSIVVRSRSSLFNEISLNCSSGLVLPYFIFCQQNVCYDHMTSQSPLQVCFLFIHSCKCNWVACVMSFFTLWWRVFYVYSPDIIFAHTRLTHKKLRNDILTLKLTLIKRHKVEWVCYCSCRLSAFPS